MITTKNTTIYVCEDGKEFLDEEEAKKHQVYILVKGMEDMRSGEWYREDVIDFIVDNRKELQRIFTEND
jgi:hypothetical protein